MTEERRQVRQNAEANPERGTEEAATEQQVTGLIFLILSGDLVVDSVADAITSLLRRLPDTSDEAADAVGRLVAQDAPRPKASGAVLRSHLDNLSYRAHYAINATRRIGERMSEGESLRGALAAERAEFQRHLDASRDRVAGAKMNEAAAERFGSRILSWRDTGRAKEHTAKHLAASGANYDIDNPPASTDGYLPGQRYNCDCVPAPPIPGARLLL